jgi:actin-like ATPase involved in cell morphogenesis
MPTQKTAAEKSTKRTAKKHETSAAGRWSAKVTSDSTHPQKGLFLKSPSTIAHELATEKVSPKGPASGMRMLTFYINRAGKNLGKGRLADLQKAKKILSEIIASHKTDTGSKDGSNKKGSTKKSTRKKAP